MNRTTRITRENGWVAGALVLALLALTIAERPVWATASKPALTGVVNLNTATAEQLRLLPGVGQSRAEAILAARRERGGFKSIDELTQVKGIGTTMLERMRAHITLMGRTTARGPGQAPAAPKTSTGRGSSARP